MKIDNFSGGLNTRISPQLIGSNEAPIFTNINNTSNSLKPIKDVGTLGTPVSGKYFTWYKHLDEVISSGNERSYQEYRNILYYTDVVDGMKKYDGTEKDVGIDKPLTAPSYNKYEIPEVTNVSLDPIYIGVPNIKMDVGSVVAGQWDFRIYGIKEVSGYTYRGRRIDHTTPIAKFSQSWALKYNVLEEFKPDTYVAFRYDGSDWFRVLNNSVEDSWGSLSTETETQWLVGKREVNFYAGEFVEYAIAPYKDFTTQKDTSVRVYNTEDYRSGIHLDSSADCIKIDANYNLTDGTINAFLFRKDGDLFKKVSANKSDYGISVSNNAELSTFGTDVLNDSVKYVYTYYDSTTNTESQPSDILEVVNSVPSFVELQIALSTNTSVDTIKVYRIGEGITDFTLVNQSDNNTLEWFYDLGQDISGNLILESSEYGVPPTNMKYLTSAYAMMFGAVGDKLYFSAIGNANYWSEYDFIDFDADITGIAVIGTGILVFTALTTFIITGTDKNTFSKQLLSNDQGCRSHYSIAYIKGNVLWVSDDGVCSTTGGVIDVITQDKLGKLDLTVNNAIGFDSQYWLAHSTGTLVLDFRFGFSVKEYTSSSISKYLVKDDSLYQYRIDPAHTVYEMFKGDDVSYEYLSPLISEGDIHNYKLLDTLRVDSKGVGVIKLLDEDKNTLKTFNITSSNYETHILDVGLNVRSYYINITGTAEIRDISTIFGQLAVGGDSASINEPIYKSYYDNGVYTQVWESGTADMTYKNIDGLRFNSVDEVNVKVYVDNVLKQDITKTVNGVFNTKLNRFNGYSYKVITTGEVKALKLTIVRKENNGR